MIDLKLTAMDPHQQMQTLFTPWYGHHSKGGTCLGHEDSAVLADSSVVYAAACWKPRRDRLRDHGRLRAGPTTRRLLTSPFSQYAVDHRAQACKHNIKAAVTSEA